MSETAVLAPDAAALAGPAASPLGARWRSVAANPAVVQARPALILIALIVAVVLAVLALRTPEWRPLWPGLSEADAAAVTDALAAANFEYRINADTGTVEVAAGDVARARILLAGQGLPKSSASAGTGLDNMPLGASRSVEAARLKASLERELAMSVEAIEGVKAARVHVATAEPSVFIRDRAAPSASVFITLAPGRSLSEAQVRAVIWLVATSVPGLAGDRVSVVDQSGSLLSAGVSGDGQQLAYQQRLEGLVRERLLKLLTPMLGAGRFTAEVAADVDFSQNEAATERFQPQGTVKTEQTSRNMEASPPPAAGIPGALTNTVPQAAQVTGNPPPPGAAAAQPPVVTAETASRMWEIGKDVSVTRAGAPRVKRLSVAVVLDTAALGKGAAGARDIANIQRLVRGAMGYDAARGDLVEVQMRAFAAEPAVPKAWYQAPAVENYGPWAALGGGVLLLAGIGFMIWRGRRKAKAAALAAAIAAGDAKAAAAAASSTLGNMLGAIGLGGLAEAVGIGPVSAENFLGPDGKPLDGGELKRAAPQALDYQDKLGQARDLVTGDRDRAMAVARQMLLADQRQPNAASPQTANADEPDNNEAAAVA